MVDRVLHAPMPFTAGGQTINDRLTAARHSLAGSQLGKTVCKATTEEPIGPKKKHLDYLLHCTHEPNVSIPNLAILLIDRVQSHNWAVVFKSLITIHNLMCYGNERFSQYLASSNANFDLGNFLDKTSLQGYDMSTHVRRYAKYISEKVYTYRLCAFDFCKVKRGKEAGLLRTMSTDKLLKSLPILQGQVDALLEFQVTASELTNGIINSCFILLFRDLIRLFACYNDGIINLLEKYFDMNKKQCREALDLYKKFLTRMDNVADFLKVAESVGVDKGEIPDLARAPGSLLEALEQHLVALEGGKASAISRVTSPSIQSAINFTSATSNSTSSEFSVENIDEATKKKYLQEEETRLNDLKEKRIRETSIAGGSGSSGTSQPFRAGSTSTAPGNSTGLNLLDSPPRNQSVAPQSSLADLLSLNTNPFLANAESAANAVTSQVASPFDWTEPMTNLPAPMFSAYAPIQPSASPVPTSNAFASEDAFANAFNSTSYHQQQASYANNSNGVLDPLGSDLFGSGSTGSKAGHQPQTQSNGRLVENDLDNSIASLALNLNLKQDGSTMIRAPVQWTGGHKPAVAMNATNLHPSGGVSPGGGWAGGMAAGSRPPYGSMSSMQQQPRFAGQGPPSRGWNASPSMSQPVGMSPNMQVNMMNNQQRPQFANNTYGGVPGNNAMMMGGGGGGHYSQQAQPQQQYGGVGVFPPAGQMMMMTPPVGGGGQAALQQQSDPFGLL